MSSAPEPLLDEWLFQTIDGLHAQKFRTAGLRAEQDFLLYLCLQNLWQLFNNAYQGDGRQLLNRAQTERLQRIDGYLQALEKQMPAPLVTEAQHCLRTLLYKLEDPSP